MSALRCAAQRKAETPNVSLPRWARAADYVVVILGALALVIACSGGVRIREWHFTMTSPYRLLFWAVAIATWRHAVVRQEPIYRHLSAAIARVSLAPPFRAAAAAFIGTRVAIFLVGYLAVFVVNYPVGAPPFEYRNGNSELQNLPLRWDAGWYVGIAKFGYQYSQQVGTAGQQSIVFFPALPMAMRVVAVLFGGTPGSYVLAGTLISLVAFFGGLVYVYLIARGQLNDDESRVALWLLAAFPFAYFFGAIYTESLFLLGSAGAFYHTQHRQFGRAALCGLLVGLTKPNGFLLTVPLVLIALSPWLPRRLMRRATDDDGEGQNGATAHILAALGAAVTPVLGTLLFSLYIWKLTGFPLAWAEGHAAWGRHYTGLGVLIADRYDIVANQGLTGYVSQLPLDFLNAVGVVFVLFSVWPVARRLGLPYALFIVLSLVPALAEGGMLSAGRLSSVLFPAFIWYAAVIPLAHRSGWIASFAANQALNASLFYTWRQLF